GVSVQDVVGDAVFEEEHESMVLVRDIEVYSLCEHHMLPFFGRAHVAYYPDGRILGLSARLFRISFTGELGFEVNVPAARGLAVCLRSPANSVAVSLGSGERCCPSIRAPHRSAIPTDGRLLADYSTQKLFMQAGKEARPVHQPRILQRLDVVVTHHIFNRQFANLLFYVLHAVTNICKFVVNTLVKYVGIGCSNVVITRICKRLQVVVQ
ncbi:MAG: GTP cyclohydrolase I, partial [Proteobacteria bacterium]|nr:GTP cyclohydrolase I [Pseudomonadota bacterium]